MLILRFLLHIIRVLITRDIQVEGLWTIRHRIIITTETITVAIIIITEIMETTVITETTVATSDERKTTITDR